MPIPGIPCGRSSDLQAPYSLSLPSSGLNQCSIELSFLLTAAGQLRIFTGFPFQPDLCGSGATKYLEYSSKKWPGQISAAVSTRLNELELFMQRDCSADRDLIGGHASLEEICQLLHILEFHERKGIARTVALLDAE
jgi:hypothetical protein